MQTVIPTAADDALTNPGMGLYLNGTLDPDDMPPDAWFTDLISVGYFRDDWAEIEPDGDDGSGFDAYFGPIFDLWVEQWGKRVSFRFMSSNMHSRREYVSPEWVFDRGVPFVVHKGLYVDRQVDPVFWDETYLQIQERFIERLGDYLDGRPGLEFIDIGCIGEWGEMHLSRWTPEELEQTGFTQDRYIAAYRRIIDAFARAFPNTRVFLNVGDYESINDYAALRGLHFRQDGLTPTGPSADVGNRFYRPYSRRGVICNYEFHSSIDDMARRGWGIRETFEKGLEDPISYLHLNLTYYSQLKDPPARLREAILDAGRRIGFRFVLKRLRLNPVIHVDGEHPARLLLEATWANEGIAPCYESYALRWSLVDEADDVAAEALAFPRRPTTLWWPGEEVTEHFLLRLPAALAPGQYRLRVAMVEPEAREVRIELGMGGRDGQGRYDLCSVEARRIAHRPSIVYEADFDADAAGWVAADGMSVSAPSGAHMGRGGLLVEGTQPGTSWNYAWVPVDVLPGSRYRLSGWVKVDDISLEQPPYLKLGVDDADGRWITNFNTPQYDLSDLGTWQELVTYAETPANAAAGAIAIEKGVLEASIATHIHLDDVNLELLESP